MSNIEIALIAAWAFHVTVMLFALMYVYRLGVRHGRSGNGDSK